MSRIEVRIGGPNDSEPQWELVRARLPLIRAFIWTRYLRLIGVQADYRRVPNN